MMDTKAPVTIRNHSYDDGDEESGWFNERLFKTRTILLGGRVDDTLARLVNQSLLILEADAPGKPIDLVVNSGGGSVSSGFAIFDVLRYISSPVRMISAGMTGSIATIIYAAQPDPKMRISLPNSQFLIHQPLIPMNVFGVTSDLEITANEIIKTRMRINEILAETCRQPLETVVEDTMRDYWMDAAEACEYGLVGRIVTSRSEL